MILILKKVIKMIPETSKDNKSINFGALEFNKIYLIRLRNHKSRTSICSFLCVLLKLACSSLFTISDDL